MNQLSPDFLRLPAIRGTSGTPRRTKLTRYRCSLPGLAEFAGNRRTEPEVPPIGVAEKFLPAPLAKSSTAASFVKSSREDRVGLKFARIKLGAVVIRRRVRTEGA